MRAYPRLLSKGKDDRITVNNESEEYKAGLDGYESHWNEEVNQKQKGTDKEVLRVNPDKVVEEIKEEIKKEIKKTPKKKTKKDK